MTDGNGLLRDKSLALLAAESRLAELRLGVGAAPGNSDFECSQGRLRLYCEQRVEATDDPAPTVGGNPVCARSANRRCRWRA